MMTMFGTLVQKLTSPVTSPTSNRRRYQSPSRWEVQSDPEDDSTTTTIRKSRAKYLLDKRKSKSKVRGINDSELRLCSTGNSSRWCDTTAFPLRGTKSLGRLDGMKEVQRLAEYERYLNQDERNSVDDSEAVKSSTSVHSQHGQLEGDLHRIQELFPNDNLRLHETDVLTTKPKHLLKKRSGGNTARLTRALSQKNLQNVGSPAPKSSSPRKFLLETSVQFTTGVQSQDRHLFLFTDLLLIAKSRSGGTFKLKQMIKMSELWMTGEHIEDVAETNKSQETSFVLGWPTTNVVATFMTAAARDLWWGKLSEIVREESTKEPPDTNIQVLYHENETNTEYCKRLMVSSKMTASACVNLATRLLDLQGPFQLWARTSLDEAPYPLIGHERPFAIKLSNLRHTLSTEEGFDLDHCNKSGHDSCHFILRTILKSPLKKSKSKISGLLRRSLSLNPSIFGVSLSRLDDNGLPKPVLVMLQQIFTKGPFIQGIFRKSANVRIVRELRDQIEASGDSSCLEDAPIIAVAALLKDFLRSLPDPLLTSHLFTLWMAALESSNPVQTIKSILDRLPKANYTLLTHLICVLHHIARRSKHNLMCASNLGVCCGPSLLWSSSPTVNHSRAVPALTEILIRHCEVLFGDGVTQLLGEERNDSGAEESTDSLHSGGLSLDSLDLTELPRKDHMSLSRDSGLTLSDCQLFIPESPIGSEDSPVSVSLSEKEKITSKSSYIRIYNNGWEERFNCSYQMPQNVSENGSSGSSNPNPNFQRQDWLRAQLKRTPRSKLDEDYNRKERSDEKEIYIKDYNRHNIMKESSENCEEIVFRKNQMRQECSVQTTELSSERVSLNDSEGSTESTISQEVCEFHNKTERLGFNKIVSELYTTGASSQNGSYKLTTELYDIKKLNNEIYVTINRETSNTNNHYDYERHDNNIYSNRENSKGLYGKRTTSLYIFKQGDNSDQFSENSEQGARVWPETPPPLPPRLRHLPPVHMSLEERHKVNGKSKSLPPPPPYRPPPQPRAPGNTKRLVHRSIVDDESYV